MDLNSIISALTGNNLIGEIAKKFNIDPNKIINVIKEAIPKFLSAMQKNAPRTCSPFWARVPAQATSATSWAVCWAALPVAPTAAPTPEKSSAACWERFSKSNNA